MKVYNLTTRKVEEYDDGYAARLIEQGKAILPKEKAEPKEKAAKTEEAPKETAKAGKAGGK